MPSLRELQRDARAALLEGDETAALREIVDDGLAPAARLAVYRHHVLDSLTAALEATFPSSCGWSIRASSGSPAIVTCAPSRRPARASSSTAPRFPTSS